jgi:hypothetical protein
MRGVLVHWRVSLYLYKYLQDFFSTSTPKSHNWNSDKSEWLALSLYMASWAIRIIDITYRRSIAVIALTVGWFLSCSLMIKAYEKLFDDQLAEYNVWYWTNYFQLMDPSFKQVHTPAYTVPRSSSPISFSKVWWHDPFNWSFFLWFDIGLKYGQLSHQTWWWWSKAMYHCIPIGKVQIQTLTHEYQDCLVPDVFQTSCQRLSKMWKMLSSKK